MLGSIIKISKLIFAMFALRICAKLLEYRYNYCIPTHLALKKARCVFAYSANASKNKPVAVCDQNNGGFMKSNEIISTVFCQS